MIPAPAPWLTPLGKRIWKRVFTKLVADNNFEATDVLLLDTTAGMVADFIEMVSMPAGPERTALAPDIARFRAEARRGLVMLTWLPADREHVAAVNADGVDLDIAALALPVRKESL